MTITIPEGVYTMKAKRSIVRAYKKASRQQKSAMLDDLVKATHLHRKYLTMLLNNTGKVRYTSRGIKLVGDPTITYLHKRGRKKKYTRELLPYLKALWVLTGYRSSVHLRAFITEHQSWVLAGIPSQEIKGFPKKMREILRPLQNIPPAIQELLRTISSATIERLLKPVKDQYRLKHKYRPHPHASMLKKKIPVESHFDKPVGRLGYTELDTVHHCGLVSRGSYCLTLTEVETTTHWVELRALRNKAHQWVYQALKDIDQTLPFKVNTRHVDGGSEFINRALWAYTQARGVRYVRSRAYHKNDNPVVESRQWTLVRSQVGYRRYDTDAEYQVLTRLMPLISLKNNYFMPTMKTIKKVRIGGKVRKKYEIDTPYKRVLKSAALSKGKKQTLMKRKTSLSYLKLLQEIMKLQRKLDQVYRKKYNHFPKDEE